MAKRQVRKTRTSTQAPAEPSGVGDRKVPFDSNYITLTPLNYYMMIGGVLLIMLGLVIMSMESAQYGFGSLALTIGPIIIFIGFIVEFFAIFYKPKEATEETN